MIDASFVDVPRQRNSKEDNADIKKSGKTHYEYKDHINADTKTKIITKFSVSSAEIEEFLEKQNCESFVHEKGYRNNPLTDEQKESNNIKSKI